MKRIEAKEAAIRDKKKGVIEKIKDRYSYQIKRMEVMRGQYDIYKQVVLQQNALMKAITYYAVVQKTQGTNEVMGWLAGKKENNHIEIVDAYIGNCYSSSAYTELDPLETIKMREMAKERGLSIVGQWHVHPGFSTTPSPIDNDFMRTNERFGMKDAVQLIVNSNDFSLTIFNNGRRRKVDFIIPPKTDNHIGLTLGSIKGEYVPPNNGYGVYGDFGNMGNESLTGTKDFYGYVGNIVFICVGFVFPFFKRWITW